MDNFLQVGNVGNQYIGTELGRQDLLEVLLDVERFDVGRDDKRQSYQRQNKQNQTGDHRPERNLAHLLNRAVNSIELRVECIQALFNVVWHEFSLRQYPPPDYLGRYTQNRQATPWWLAQPAVIADE